MLIRYYVFQDLLENDMERWRHLLVALLVVPVLILYIIAAMVLSQFITGFSGLIDLVYFVVAGLGWIPGAAIVIRWLADNEAH